MRKYQKYKASGVDWLGEIPSDWQCMKIKRLTVVKRGASPRPIDDPKYFDENGEFAWVRIADVTASERYLENTTQRLSKIGSSLSVKRYPGDLFLSIAATVGKPIIAKVKCCIHDGFVWFPYLKTNPEFLYYLFSTGLPYQGLGKMGTQLNLNTDTVGDINLPIPKDDEINDIVSFLNYKTRQIDSFIANRQKQIELLQEQKASIINKAVTKGINLNAKMKDSGIEWIEQIPENWSVWKLKYLTKKISKGTTPSTEGREILETGGIRFLKAENITPDGISLLPEFFIDEETNQILKRSQLQRNDILFVIAGATIGKAAIITDEFIPSNTNQAVCFIRLKKNVLPELILNQFQSSYIKNKMAVESVVAAQPNISMENIGNFQIFLPPIHEQVLLLKFIKEEAKSFDTLISKYQKQIDLMQEYRTSLISQAVTGKIDVREWQPKKNK